MMCMINMIACDHQRGDQARLAHVGVAFVDGCRSRRSHDRLLGLRGSCGDALHHTRSGRGLLRHVHLLLDHRAVTRRDRRLDHLLHLERLVRTCGGRDEVEGRGAAARVCRSRLRIRLRQAQVAHVRAIHRAATTRGRASRRGAGSRNGNRSEADLQRTEHGGQRKCHAVSGGTGKRDTFSHLSSWSVLSLT